jgi:hypothetical protein
MTILLIFWPAQGAEWGCENGAVDSEHGLRFVAPLRTGLLLQVSGLTFFFHHTFAGTLLYVV